MSNSNIVINDLTILAQKVVDDQAMFTSTNKVKMLYDQMLIVLANIQSIQSQITELQATLGIAQTQHDTLNTDLSLSKSELASVLQQSIQSNL